MESERKRDLERAFLTTPARALCGLLREGGKVKRSLLKRYAGSQYSHAIHVLVTLGLAVEHEDRSVELTEEGKKLASCICKCFE